MYHVVFSKYLTTAGQLGEQIFRGLIANIMDLAKKNIPQVEKLIENGFFIQHEGYLFPSYEIKDTGMEKFRLVFKMLRSIDQLVLSLDL